MYADHVVLVDEIANVLEGETERRRGILEKNGSTNKWDYNGIV